MASGGRSDGDWSSVFGRSVDSYRRYLLAVANRRLGNSLGAKAGASDVVNEAMLKAHLERHTFRGGDRRARKAWMRKILVNHVANVVRAFGRAKRTPAREVPFDDPDRPGGPGPNDVAVSTLSPVERATQNEILRLVAQSLESLDERERRVIVMRFYDNFTFAEIGRDLGGSPDLAEKICARALQRLRSRLGTDSSDDTAR